MSRFFATGSDSDSDSSSEEEQIIRQPVTAFTFSDEEEDTKRIVRSAKEKRYEEITNLIKQIRNFKKNKDMSSLLSSFEDLMRAYTKALPVISKEENGLTPRFYLRCLVEVEDFVNEVWEDRDGRKNMSKNNSKSLTSLRQKMRKYIKDFEEEMTKFRSSPDQGDDEEEEEKDQDSDSDDDEDSHPVVTKKPSVEPAPEPKKAAAADDDEDDGSDSSYWGSDSDSSSSSSDDETQYQNVRERFLKKPGADKDDKKEAKESTKDSKRRGHKKKPEREESSDGEGEWETVKGGVAMPSEKPKMFAKDAEINIDLVVKKLNEIVAARGKKRTDRREQIELLHELLIVSEQHNLGSAVSIKIKFAIVSSIFDYNPKVSDAMKPEYWAKLLEQIIDMLDRLNAAKDVVINETILEDHEVYDAAPYQLRGCVLTIVERLDEEFIKLLKECDPHSNEYVERLKDETRETIQHSDPPTQILYNRTMAHLGLCAFRHSNIKDAHNCLVDLMMTGKMKELLAQGLLPTRQNDRTKEQEKVEKQRQMPFHMHINLELLECVYMVSAMLIEIPYMAEHEFDARRRMISKTFYQQLRSSERQSLLGPPESMREHVVAASKAMRNGNWLACRNFIVNEKMNAKVWDLFYQADDVRTMLTRLIREEALRTYLFTYSHVYDSISMASLAETFELDPSVVHSIISKMIINEELMASLDDPTHTVVMHRSEPSRLQSLALQLTDKVNSLVDYNERVFETKQGFFNRGGNQGNFRDRQNYDRRGQDWGRQRRERGERAY
ncbi:hypothetical protein ONE63_010803 [Megalurothrips usitatus]|uniref:Eukaryotic translation initiation factor 3 subunit C n=1 Tax=Megalurothrips usitatus TaxID=439358 RepID=A0AAV7XE52_9NEOP|nr:hypothetical protein ONE63_010803 [Megalurothrips usitatus]